MRQVDRLASMAAENAPVGFCDVRACRAGSMRVSASGQMAVNKFHCEDFGAALQSGKCLSGDIPVDGLEGALISFLRVLGLLAACQNCLSKRQVTVLPLIVRLALEAGMSGTILEGAAQLLRWSVARALVQTLI